MNIHGNVCGASRWCCLIHDSPLVHRVCVCVIALVRVRACLHVRRIEIFMGSTAANNGSERDLDLDVCVCVRECVRVVHDIIVRTQQRASRSHHQHSRCRCCFGRRRCRRRRRSRHHRHNHHHYQHAGTYAHMCSKQRKLVLSTAHIAIVLYANACKLRGNYAMNDGCMCVVLLLL